MNHSIIQKGLNLSIEDDSKNDTENYTIGRHGWMPLALYLWFSSPHNLPEERILMLVMPEFSMKHAKNISKISTKEIEKITQTLTKNLEYENEFRFKLLRSDFVQLVLMHTSLYKTGMIDSLPQVPNKTYLKTKQDVSVYDIHSEINKKIAYVLEECKNLLSYEGSILRGYEIPYDSFKPIMAEKYYGF